MTYEQNYTEDELNLQTIKDELLAVQASNIALAAIISHLPETLELDAEEVKNTCAIMSEMDAHTEMVTGEFVSGIIDVAKEIKRLNEGE